MDQPQIEGLRNELADAVGRKALPEPVWDVLLGRGHVHDFLEKKITQEELVTYARALLFYGDVVKQAASEPESRQKQPLTEPPRFDLETERAKTLARYLELRVTSHPSVLRLRQNWFVSGLPLSHEEALLLRDSPDLRKSRSGRERAQEIGEQEREIEVFVDEEGGHARVGFEPGSFLEQLKEVSNELREKLFPPWSEPEAVHVIVSGKVWQAPRPVVGKMTDYEQAKDYVSYGTIDLRVEPWVPTSSVVSAYQYLQAQMLGKKPRTLIQRNLRVVQFVMEQLRELVMRDPEDTASSPRISWRKLMDRWNEAHPAADAYNDERHFHRDFRRTANAVVRPYDADHFVDQDFSQWLGSATTLEG
jgi:hypothetical protein